MSNSPRTYIVTGGGGGIGGATVLRLLKTGANVLAVDISSKRMLAVKETAASLPGKMENPNNNWFIWFYGIIL